MLFDGLFYLHWKDTKQLEPVNGGEGNVPQ